jgi:hypothetical protein
MNYRAVWRAENFLTLNFSRTLSRPRYVLRRVLGGLKDRLRQSDERFPSLNLGHQFPRISWLTELTWLIVDTLTDTSKHGHTFQLLWATGWTIEVVGFDTRRGLRNFLFTIASKMALGPTQPPIQGVLGALFLGVKRPGREADQSPPTSAEVKEWMELYPHSLSKPSWRGA